MRRLAVIAGAMTLTCSAWAAGIDSRTYTCAALHSLIEERRFVFISQATFGDFVVADVSYCSRGAFIQLRSVPTSDTPECIVNYCVGRTINSD